ncbi:hypothetical protein BWZ20_01695 [Winogradskyella sp. J14-2]|uniref:hypothetical protein n=1 Tax=Winogradskyella sp. J14-2 TaxID=1936080 RepID=UPI0009727E1F|nr:hypothetical protein [Winogradskyella sp. J14-2]APY07093.1 hypothetical protein BWZ20_01695 [Winogradskyella sp. J14-2]
MKPPFKLFIVFILLGLSIGCSSDDSQENDQDPQPMIFEVDPLIFRQYDIERPPSTNDFAAVYGMAVFAPQPAATLYTLTYESSTSPNLNFTISWENGEAIPTRGAPVVPDDIPGYNLGIVGGQYHIVILSTGCEGPPGGSCQLGSDGLNQIENNLRSIEGTVTVQIDFE